MSRGFILQKQIHLKTQQDHAEEILHFNDLLCSFTNDFEIIAEEFEQLIESSHDGTPDHDIL
eukprot:12925600-Ditylum_brightwellii.AAC.1